MHTSLIDFFKDHPEASAAILGSVIGGLISLIVAYFSFRTTRNTQLLRDEEERMRSSKLSAFRFYTGYRHLMSRNYQLKRHMDEALARTPELEAETGQPAEPWMVVQATISLPAPASFFSTDDLAFLFEAQEFELLGNLDLLQARTLTNLISMEKFNALKQAMDDKLTLTRLHGEFAVSEQSASDAKLWERDAAILNQLIAQIVEGIEDDVKMMEKLIEPLGSAVKRHFKDPDFPVLKLEE